MGCVGKRGGGTALQLLRVRLRPPQPSPELSPLLEPLASIARLDPLRPISLGWQNSGKRWLVRLWLWLPPFRLIPPAAHSS